jgi:hypothetical protein
MPQLVQLAILIGVLLLLAIALFAWFVARRGSSPAKLPDDTQAMIPDAQVEQYERPASLVAEQIEGMVRHKLEQYPDLADVVLDFGAMPDGTIDIWVNRRQYDNPEDIPDERIRQAIKEAVEQFNV